MSQSLSPHEFHRQYEELITAFRQHLPDATVRYQFSQDVDAFFRSCALGVWKHSGTSIGTSHVEYYNAIYSQEDSLPSILYWELVSSTDRYAGFSIPALFERFCRYDLEFRKDTAARFVYDCSLILLLFAAVDGGVSQQEARFIQSCCDALEAYRRGKTLPEGKQQVDLSQFISNATDALTENHPFSQAETPATATASQAEADTAQPSFEELMSELDGLCGLEKVKEEVHSLINLVKVRKLREENGLPSPALSLHMVFMGNPGTGKTTVARLLAGLYREIGVLSKGQLVEVDRSGLVAGFVGQTALKTSEVIQKALGGVLFIDEAYALANQEGGNDFGREAIEILLKGMEDHRDDLLVIVAGYTNLMGKFLASNPGLESRFNKYLYFDDYNGQELMQIFRSMCQKNHYALTEASKAAAENLFLERFETRDENFGNAREVRNEFEKAVSRQANRLAAAASPSKEDLMTLLPEDLENPTE